MTTTEKKLVTVACAIKGGLVLRLYKPHFREEGAVMPDPEAAPVTLKHGGNPNIDADFMKAWLEENAGSDFVRNKMVYVVEPKERADGDGEPGVDNVTERPDKESSIDAPAPKAEGEEDQKPAE